MGRWPGLLVIAEGLLEPSVPRGEAPYLPCAPRCATLCYGLDESLTQPKS